jgi:hypothetical protein
MPIIWIARMMGLPIRHRVAGSDIFDRLKKRYSTRPLKTFLFGGAAGIATMVAHALNAKPLGLSCVGSLYPGYGTVDLMSTDEILDTINSSRADFLAVALSASKGQAWLHRNRGRLRVPIRAQLGAAINVPEFNRLVHACGNELAVIFKNNALHRIVMAFVFADLLTAFDVPQAADEIHAAGHGEFAIGRKRDAEHELVVGR